MKQGKNKKTKKNSKRQKGFTMIELILVITVLGILAVMALPSFYDVSSSAKVSARDGIIGAVKGGVNMFRADALTRGVTPVVPAILDAAVTSGPCAIANTCFSGVLQDAITAANWCTTGVGAIYRWQPTNFAAATCAAVAGTTTTCTYTAATGALACVAD